MGGKEILHRFTHLVRPAAKPKEGMPPFDSMQELVVAQVISNLQNRNGSAGIKATIDTIGQTLSRDEINDSIDSLQRKEIVVRHEHSLEITHNGEMAVRRALEAQKEKVQEFLAGRHSGIPFP